MGEIPKVQNPKLYEKLKEYAKAALDFLKTNFRPEYLEAIPTEDYEFHNGVLKKTVNTLYFDYLSFFERHRRELESLKEVDSCIQVMLNEGIPNKPKSLFLEKNLIENPSEEQMKPFFIEVLISFLERLVKRTNSFDFDEKKFRELYADYENFWHSKKLEFIGLVPLFNFECSIEGIPLNDVEISRFTDEEKSTLSKGWGMFRPIRPMELSRVKYKLAIPYDLEKGQTMATSEVIGKKMDKILTSLRLFKSGDVHYNTIYLIPRTFNPNHGISSTTSSLKPVVPLFGKTYILDDMEIDNFIEFFKEYEKIVSLGGYEKLDIAIRKLNDSYNRVVPEDKIIDYVIAFESILLFGIDRELRYRFSVRGAMLLEKNSTKRKDTFNIMMGLYDVRSLIVHHGKKIPPKINIKDSEYTSKEFISIVEDLLRRSITEYGRRMLKGNSIDTINEELDDVVFETEIESKVADKK